MSNKQNWLRITLLVVVLASLALVPALAGAQAENGFTAPTDGASVSGTVDVTGYADTSDFLRWDLFVLPGGSDSAKTWVASGSTAGEFSVSLDTTKYPDGDHALSLRVVKASTWNYDEYLVNFTIANAGAAPAAEAAPAEEAAPVESTEAVTETVAAATVEAAPVVATQSGLALEDGASVSGAVDVTGYADTSDFLRWDLFVLPGSSDSAKAWLASGSTAGEFSVSLDTTKYPDGDHALSLRVVKALTQNYDEYLVNFTIANAGAPAVAAPVEASDAVTETAAAETVAVEAAPVAEAAPVVSDNGLAIEDGATISGTVEIKGYADTPGFKKWDLFVLPGGSDGARAWLASGETAGEFTVTIDTSKYPDGDHVLSLRVVRADSNYDEYLVNFTIANSAE